MTDPRGELTSIQPAPGIRWSVEAAGLRIVDASHTVYELGYPDAAIWDLLSRGYDFERAVVMLTHIAALSRDDAEALIRRCLERWCEQGLLQKGSGHGQRLRHLPMQP